MRKDEECRPLPDFVVMATRTTTSTLRITLHGPDSPALPLRCTEPCNPEPACEPYRRPSP